MDLRTDRNFRRARPLDRFAVAPIAPPLRRRRRVVNPRPTERFGENPSVTPEFSTDTAKRRLPQGRGALPTLPRVLRKLRPAPQFIVRLNGKAINAEVGETLRANGLDVALLYDASGGQGITPERWQAPKGDYCGYAGGLSLANIEAQIPLIREAAGSARVYLDLEAGARDAQDRFDMDAVKLLLEIVAPHIDA